MSILAGLYAVLAISLDLVAGRLGMISMAHAAFYGTGSYVSALLAVQFGLPFGISFVAAAATACVLSLLVSIPSLRLHGDYFAITTFAFQMILFGVLNNWMEVTRGPLGIPGIPHPKIFGWNVDTHWDFFILVAVVAAVAAVVSFQVVRSPFGRVLHAIREDELFVQAMGKNALSFKVITFAVSAAFAAAAGSVYAHYVTYIDPTGFTAMESILIISMVIIGGAGSFLGPVVGAILLVILPEALRFIGVPTSLAANIRQIVYGALLVIMMMYRPRGLIGNYNFGR